MHLRPLVIGSAVVLATCVSAGAVGSSASALGTSPAARSTASTHAAPDSVIRDVNQEQVSLDAARSVKVTVAVRTTALVRLIDSDGDCVQAAEARADHPAVFWVRPTGQDTASYAVEADGSRTPVELDFRGLALSAPVDQSSDRELDARSRAVARGQLDHRVRYEALPGATVTVAANGVTNDVVADASGTAVVPVHFQPGDNEVQVRQQLGDKASETDVDHFRFGDADGAGAGSGSGDGHGELPGDGHGEVPGDGQGELPGDGHGDGQGDGHGELPGDGEQVAPSALTVDVADGSVLSSTNGKVTLSGTASAGIVSVREGRDVIGTTRAHDGRWSVEVALSAGQHALDVALSATPDGAALARQIRFVQVLDQGAADAVASFHVDLDGPLPVADGRATVSGTATTGEVVVRDTRNGGAVLGTAEVRAGHWSVSVPARDGVALLAFEYHPTAGGAAATTERHEVTFATPGVDPQAPFALDQTGGPIAAEDGFVTFSGTAPGAQVAVLERGKRIAVADVTNGRWTVRVPLSAGTHALTFRSLGGQHVGDKNLMWQVTAAPQP